MKLENGFTEKINFYISGLNLNAFLPWKFEQYFQQKSVHMQRIQRGS